MLKKKNISNKIIHCFALLLSLTVLLIAACKSKESYQKEIKQKGLTYSIESFLERVEVGNKEIIELFMKAGMDVNAKGNYGETALMLASLNDKVETVNLLIKKGANVNIKSNTGDTAFEYAYLNTQIKELLRKAMAEKEKE